MGRASGGWGRGLMISHEHRCIFVHIPKAAGSSIESRLGLAVADGSARRDHRTIRELEPVGWRHFGPGLVPPDPYFLKRMRNSRQGLMAPTAAQYGDYFKFTFVRNSWSRVYSWYRNVMNDPRHRARRGIDRELGLREFLEEHPGDWGLRSQLYWLQDSSGGLPFDFVGRFERLAEDFAVVAGELGLAEAELPHLTRGEGHRYTEYFDEETVALVAARYGEEIEAFAFGFGE